VDDNQDMISDLMDFFKGTSRKKEIALRMMCFLMLFDRNLPAIGKKRVFFL